MEDLLIKALATKKTKEFILAHPEYKLTPWQKLRLFYFNYLRKKGYSLAYIAGHKEFFGLNFLVNKHTLIPRPDTELMVEETIKEIEKIKNKKIVLVDIGTGTGCIPISINKKMSKNLDIKIFATDISLGALKIARKNSKKHKVKINFLHGDLLKPFIKIHSLLHPPYSLFLTANLPYLTQNQFEAESSIQKEPHAALVADDRDGLSLYKKLLLQLKLLKQTDLTVFLEIDPSQNLGIMKIINEIFPAPKIEIKNDLAGRDRLVIIRVN